MIEKVFSRLLIKDLYEYFQRYLLGIIMFWEFGSYNWAHKIWASRATRPLVLIYWVDIGASNQYLLSKCSYWYLMNKFFQDYSSKVDILLFNEVVQSWKTKELYLFAFWGTRHLTSEGLNYHTSFVDLCEIRVWSN